MFLGEFRHTIDEKGRLTIPAKFRGLLAAGMVITRGFDRNLVAYSLEGWQTLAERVQSLPITDPSAREFRRRVFAGAVDLIPDRQGRVLLPPYLRDFAGIDAEVVIAGVFSHLEIWNPDTWAAVREASEGDGRHWENLGI